MKGKTMEYVIVIKVHENRTERLFGSLRFGKFGIEILSLPDWDKETIVSTLENWFGTRATVRFEDTDIGTVNTVGIEFEWQVHPIANTL